MKTKEPLQDLLDRLPDNNTGEISEKDQRDNTTELYKAFDLREHDLDPTGFNFVTADNTYDALLQLDSALKFTDDRSAQNESDIAQIVADLANLELNKADRDGDTLTNTIVNGVDLQTGGDATKFLNEFGQYVVPPASGEFNTMTNIGASGEGVYFQKNGVQFELNKIGVDPAGDMTVSTIGNVITLNLPKDAYVKWGGEWNELNTPYEKWTMVTEDGWVMMSIVQTSDRAAPQRIGEPFYLYTGVNMVRFTENARQVCFGIRATGSTTEGYWLNGYRVGVIAGNSYEIVIVKDPSGVREVEFISSFDATQDEIREFGLEPRPVAAGTEYDLIAIVKQTTVTPVDTLANYNYSTPTNSAQPAPGQIIHADKAVDVLSISYTDNDSNNLSALIGSLNPGDIISAQGVEWAVQSVSDQITFADIEIAPHTQLSSDGVKEFTFSQIPEVSISYDAENTYWSGSPYAGEVEGLFVADGSWEDVVANDNAYEIDLLVQEASSSPDWELVHGPVGGGSGGGTITGQVLYNGVETTAFILGLDPQEKEGEVWWSKDEFIAYRATLVQTTNTYEWRPEGMIYDAETDTYKAPNTSDDQTQNLGQEMFFNGINQNGTVSASAPKLFISGQSVVGNELFKEVNLAAASDLSENSVYGINTTVANSMETVKITTYGDVKDVDTSAWAVGAILYADTTPGDLTDLRPTVDAWPIAIVKKSDAATGILFVNTITARKIDSAVIPVGVTRTWFTGDTSVLGAGTFYETSREDKGSVATATQTIIAPDDTTVWSTQDHVSSDVGGALAESQVEAEIEFVINSGGGQERLYMEVYLANNDGSVKDSGTGLPNGNLGVPPIVTLSSSLLNSPVDTTQFARLSGFVPSDVVVPAGDRLRFHIGCEKVGTPAGNKTFTIYYGNLHSTWAQGEGEIQARDVIYDNSVSGASSSDVQGALDELYSEIIRRSGDEADGLIQFNKAILSIPDANTVTTFVPPAANPFTDWNTGISAGRTDAGSYPQQFSEILSVSSTINNGFQILAGGEASNQEIFFRGIHSGQVGGFSGWKRILTEDDIVTTQFLPLAGGTMSGNIQFNAAIGLQFNSTTNNNTGDIVWYDSLEDELAGSMYQGGDNEIVIRVRNSVGGAGSRFLQLNGNGTMTWNGGTVWHSVNDGANSGLEADWTDADDSGTSWNNTIKTGLWTSSENSAADRPTEASGYADAIHWGHFGGNKYRRSIWVNQSNGDDLYYSHNLNGGAWTTQKIWTDLNFDPTGYLPLTGGTLTGDLTSQGDIKVGGGNNSRLVIANHHYITSNDGGGNFVIRVGNVYDSGIKATEPGTPWLINVGNDSDTGTMTFQASTSPVTQQNVDDGDIIGFNTILTLKRDEMLVNKTLKTSTSVTIEMGGNLLRDGQDVVRNVANVLTFGEGAWGAVNIEGNASNLRYNGADVAFVSDLGGYLPLTGGTLTGNLTTGNILAISGASPRVQFQEDGENDWWILQDNGELQFRFNNTAPYSVVIQESGRFQMRQGNYFYANSAGVTTQVPTTALYSAWNLGLTTQPISGVVNYPQTNNALLSVNFTNNRGFQILAGGPNNQPMYIRAIHTGYSGGSGGTADGFSEWRQIAESTDLEAYLPLAGGAMTGAIDFPSGVGVEFNGTSGTASRITKEGTTTLWRVYDNDLQIRMQNGDDVRIFKDGGTTEGWRFNSGDGNFTNYTGDFIAQTNGKGFRAAESGGTIRTLLRMSLGDNIECGTSTNQLFLISSTRPAWFDGAAKDIALLEDLDGYLPLTAGSSFPLTGDLYLASSKALFLDTDTVGHTPTRYIKGSAGMTQIDFYDGALRFNDKEEVGFKIATGASNSERFIYLGNGVDASNALLTIVGRINVSAAQNQGYWINSTASLFSVGTELNLGWDGWADLALASQADLPTYNGKPMGMKGLAGGEFILNVTEGAFLISSSAASVITTKTITGAAVGDIVEVNQTGSATYSQALHLAGYVTSANNVRIEVSRFGSTAALLDLTGITYQVRVFKPSA